MTWHSDRADTGPSRWSLHMDDDDLHISRIPTAWSMVREAHGDHTAVQSAQQRLLDRYGGAVRRYALSALAQRRCGRRSLSGIRPASSSAATSATPTPSGAGFARS